MAIIRQIGGEPPKELKKIGKIIKNKINETKELLEYLEYGQKSVGIGSGVCPDKNVKNMLKPLSKKKQQELKEGKEGVG